MAASFGDSMFGRASRVAGIVAGIIVLALIAATVWAVARRAPLGAVGAWFFLTLAPSSSVVPIKDLAFEHRMYLALAAVITLVVVLGVEGLSRASAIPIAARRRWGTAVLAVTAAAMTFATARRNLDYRSEISIWQDVVAKRPGNPRGLYALGAAYVMANRDAEAIPPLLAALRLQPRNPVALENLGVAYVRRSRFDEAIDCFDRVIRDTRDVSANDFLRTLVSRAHYNRGVALAGLGRYPEAIASYREAAHLAPDDPATRPEAAIAGALVRQIAGAIAACFAGTGEFAPVPGASRSGPLSLDETYRRVVAGKPVGEVRVQVDLTEPEARVHFEPRGEVPRRVMDQLSRAIAGAMAETGAERIDRPAGR